MIILSYDLCTTGHHSRLSSFKSHASRKHPNWQEHINVAELPSPSHTSFPSCMSIDEQYCNEQNWDEDDHIVETACNCLWLKAHPIIQYPLLTHSYIISPNLAQKLKNVLLFSFLHLKKSTICLKQPLILLLVRFSKC